MAIRPLRGFVFRNLHQPGVIWSIRNSAGRVLCHSANVIVKNAQFVIHPAGQAKTRREKKKYVHAGIRGEIIVDCIEAELLVHALRCSGKYVFYNPYKNDTFVNSADRPVHKARYVLLSHDGDGKSRVLYIK